MVKKSSRTILVTGGSGKFGRLIVKHLLDKGDFILESHGVGKFGRCLGSLHVDDVNINKVLVSEGHANEYYGGKR